MDERLGPEKEWKPTVDGWTMPTSVAFKRWLKLRDRKERWTGLGGWMFGFGLGGAVSAYFSARPRDVALYALLTCVTSAVGALATLRAWRLTVAMNALVYGARTKEKP